GQSGGRLRAPAQVAGDDRVRPLAGQDGRDGGCLGAADVVQRGVGLALYARIRVPFGAAVPPHQEPGHAPSSDGPADDWTADGWTADGWTADGWPADGTRSRSTNGIVGQSFHSRSSA